MVIGGDTPPNRFPTISRNDHSKDVDGKIPNLRGGQCENERM